jgi:predicted dehydrogenase
MTISRLHQSRPAPIALGVIGLGHWGPNYLRVFKMLPEATVLAAADPDRSRLAALGPLYPEVKFSRDYRAVLDNPEIRAVAITTPSSTHYALAKEALRKGKDVLVEKPLALTSAKCQKLIQLARAKKRILMVAHIFMYNPGILKIKEYLDADRMGQIYYLLAVRTNLGPVRQDVNVVFDLAAHDVSVFNFVLQARPTRVTAAGASFLKPGREDFCFITLHYPGGVLGHIHISWLTPKKQRQILIVGSRRLITWDDLDLLDPVKVHDRGSTEEPFYSDYGEFQRMARVSDVHLPSISAEEPLLLQNRHFLECVRTRSRPLSDGRNGCEVIQTLEQIQKALRRSR